MREAQIILPDLPETREARADLTHGLVALFGGVTVTKGEGFWRDPADNALVREPVAIFTVAANHGEYTAGIIQGLAIAVATAAHQKAVYVRDFDGRVEIIDLTKGDA